MAKDDFIELHCDERPDPILVRVADSRQRFFVVPVGVPDNSIMGRLLGRTKTQLETHHYTSDEPVALGPGDLWMNPIQPGEVFTRICSYCDLANFADRQRCDGCGAPLKLK